MTLRNVIDRLLWHSGATIIMFAIALHWSWAILIQISDVARNTTPVALLSHITGSPYILSAVFLLSGVTTTIGAFWPRRLVGLAMMMPQQTVLVVAAWGAVQAVMTCAYPDGTARYWLFILTDQLPIILLPVTYTVGILVYHNVFRRA